MLILWDQTELKSISRGGSPDVAKSFAPTCESS